MLFGVLEKTGLTYDEGGGKKGDVKGNEACFELGYS